MLWPNTLRPAWTPQRLLCALTSAWIVVALAVLGEISWLSGIGAVTAAVGNLRGGISTLFFYRALRQVPASVVIPVSSLYLVLTVVLSIVFLGESIGMRQILGIILREVAIFPLAS